MNSRKPFEEIIESPEYYAAFARVQFGESRFAPGDFAKAFLVTYGGRVTGRNIAIAKNGLANCAEMGMFDVAAGPRGGLGYVLSLTGWDIGADIEVPVRAPDQNAKENAGPILQGLCELVLELIENCEDEESLRLGAQFEFLFGLMTYWVTKGRLTTKQAERLTELSLDIANTVQYADLLTGSAPLEWRKAHQDWVQTQALLNKQRKEKAEEEKRNRGRAEDERHIQNVKEKWKGMQELIEAWDKGRARIDDFFEPYSFEHRMQMVGVYEKELDADLPGKFNEQALKAAMEGNGSRRLRVAIALVMDESPDILWPANFLEPFVFGAYEPLLSLKARYFPPLFPEDLWPEVQAFISRRGNSAPGLGALKQRSGIIVYRDVQEWLNAKSVSADLSHRDAYRRNVVQD